MRFKLQNEKSSFGEYQMCYLHPTHSSVLNLWKLDSIIPQKAEIISKAISHVHTFPLIPPSPPAAHTNESASNLPDRKPLKIEPML